MYTLTIGAMLSKSPQSWCAESALSIARPHKILLCAVFVVFLILLNRCAAPVFANEGHCRKFASSVGDKRSDGGGKQTASVTKITSSNCDSYLHKEGVFIFYDPSCPICREYFPTIKSLADKFADEQFYLVVLPAEPGEIDSFIKQYSPKMSLCIDEAGLLQEKMQAHVTPQAIVIHKNKIVYSGRIDDRYEGIGKRRTVFSGHDLANALTALMSGKPVAVAKTEAIGCYLEEHKVPSSSIKKD